MLPAARRVTRSAEFTDVVRHGRRAARGPVVAHVMTGSGEPSRVGLIVGRGVGGAVQRNLVKRRFRAIMAEQLRGATNDEIVVLRALPGAATASFANLRADVVGAVERARSRTPRR